jgi:hypothetical protein
MDYIPRHLVHARAPLERRFKWRDEVRRLRARLVTLHPGDPGLRPSVTTGRTQGACRSGPATAARNGGAAPVSSPRGPDRQKPLSGAPRGGAVSQTARRIAQTSVRSLRHLSAQGCGPEPPSAFRRSSPSHFFFRKREARPETSDAPASQTTGLLPHIHRRRKTCKTATCTAHPRESGGASLDSRFRGNERFGDNATPRRTAAWRAARRVRRPR